MKQIFITWAIDKKKKKEKKLKQMLELNGIDYLCDILIYTFGNASNMVNLHEPEH